MAEGVGDRRGGTGGSGGRGLLVEAGIPVTLVEADDLPRDLRASTFHPPTLDMLERFGVVESLVAQGLICPAWQFRDRRDGVVTFDLGLLAGETRHPYRLQCEQWRLAPAGVPADQRPRHHPLAKAVGISQDDREVDIANADGTTQTLHAAYAIGADGIGSLVRKAIGAGFDGQTIPRRSS